MIAVDTSFLVALDERHPAALDLERKLQEKGMDYLIPSPAWVEYLTGFSPKTTQAKARFLDKVAIFAPFDRSTAKEAVRLQRTLINKGKPLAWSDLYIAATALDHDVPLVTMDVGFDEVPGLEVLRP